MNMREFFLNSNQFSFIETNATWQEKPLFSLEKSSLKGKFDNLLNENQIFLGLTQKPLIFLEKLQLGGADFVPDLIIFASRHRSKTGVLCAGQISGWLSRDPPARPGRLHRTANPPGSGA